MSDIVERLRNEGADAMSKHLSMGMWKLCAEAADEIERLRADLELMRADRDVWRNTIWQRARRALRTQGEQDADVAEKPQR